MRNAPAAEEFMRMRPVTQRDYEEFVKYRRYVTVEQSSIPVGRQWRVDRYEPNQGYRLEGTTVWSFPDRGRWATHRGDFRGNFSPFIPRNLIVKYTDRGDWVLDQVVGGGTTLVECKLIQRNAIGVDINPEAIIVTRDRLNFTYKPSSPAYRQNIRGGCEKPKRDRGGNHRPDSYSPSLCSHHRIHKEQR